MACGVAGRGTVQVPHTFPDASHPSAPTPAPRSTQKPGESSFLTREMIEKLAAILSTKSNGDTS